MKRRAATSIVVLIAAFAPPAAAQILPPGATPTKLTPASVGGINIVFTEGALYDGNGGVYFSDMHASATPVNDPSRILRYDIASGTTSVADSLSGGTNGMYRAGGFFYTADRDGGKPTGQTRQISRRLNSDISMIDAALVTSFNSKPMNGPNDLVVDSSGGIYFTDPNYENRTGAQGVDGLYYRDPTGIVSLLKSFTGSTHRPNGVILSPGGKTLYLALQGSADKKLMAYDVAADGSISNERLFAAMAPSDPDGITIDPAGDVYAAGTKDIWAWNPAGVKLFQLSMPGTGSAQEDPTNLDFGGTDGKTLFIAAGKSLYGIHLNIATPATGDFTGDGLVNAADYTAWQDTLGSTTFLAADGDGNHIVDAADYAVWATHFSAAGSGGFSAGPAVPEPSTLLLLTLGGIMPALRRLILGRKCKEDLSCSSSRIGSSPVSV